MHPLSDPKQVSRQQGEMVEWSITTVLKTVVPRGTGGSNPSLSARMQPKCCIFFCFCDARRKGFTATGHAMQKTSRMASLSNSLPFFPAMPTCLSEKAVLYAREVYGFWLRKDSFIGEKAKTSHPEWIAFSTTWFTACYNDTKHFSRLF